MFRNKLNPDDKLLVAFDARVLSEVLGREAGLGKIVHGENYATLEVKNSALASDVRKFFSVRAKLLWAPSRQANAIGLKLSLSMLPGSSIVPLAV